MKGNVIKYIIVFSSFMFILILSIFSMYEESKYNEKFTNIQILLVYFSFILTLISFAYLIIILRSESKRKPIYISYTPLMRNYVDKIKYKYKGVIFRSIYTIEPGMSINQSTKKNIKESAFCIVLIGENLSDFQKNEIKQMKVLNKKIIPVIINENVKIPSLLIDIKPITLEDFIG